MVCINQSLFLGVIQQYQSQDKTVYVSLIHSQPTQALPCLWGFKKS